MNWGKGIAIALGTFVTFIIVLATILMSQKVDLVSEDYYQKEMAYEEEIVQLQNAYKIEEKLELSQTDDFLIVKIPEGPYSDLKMSLQRPNNDQLDLSFDIAGTRTFMVEKNKLELGRYNVAFEFNYEDAPCQQRANIFINK